MAASPRYVRRAAAETEAGPVIDALDLLVLDEDKALG